MAFPIVGDKACEACAIRPMKQLISLILFLLVTLCLQAQSESRQWLNHVDVAATAGTLYHAVPTEEGTVSAECYVNAFKPYLGFGYDRAIGRTGRCTLSLDGGVLFWGGKPHLVTHEGVDLTHDMKRINRPYLRHLVNGVSFFRVFPIIEARLA